MRRHGNLWPDIITFGNLHVAARTASRGKRFSANVARFLFDLERNLLRLEAELRAKTYQPGDYYTFRIYEPKPRLISAAPFRDRVVHHALCRSVEPIFERTFIHDSYACRKGKGTHAAIRRFTEFSRRFPYVLKCDVRKFFPSLDHEILKARFARKIKDADVLWLTNLIIDRSNAQDPVLDWFPGDNLFTPSERRRGLPIGNQTSQFLANVYLDPFDHFVKETLRAPAYLRYVDDFAIFGRSTDELAETRTRCSEFLATLRLRLHPSKSVISRVIDGTRFLGYRIFPTHRLVVEENVRRMRRRLRRLQKQYASRELSAPEIRRRIMSWVGHVKHADSDKLVNRLLADYGFTRQVIESIDEQDATPGENKPGATQPTP